MKKKIFVDNIKTISVSILFVSFIAMIVVGCYTCFVATEVVAKEARRSAISHLKNVDAVVYEKSKNISRFVDLLNMSDNLEHILESGTLGAYMSRFSDTLEEVEGCVLIDTNGKSYVYNLSEFSEDMLIQLQVGCSQLSEKPGNLKWYNIDSGNTQTPIFDKYAICGTTVFGKTAYKTYVFVNKSLFNDAIGGVGKSSLTAIFDENGRMLSSNSREEFFEVFNSSIDNMVSVYGTEEGVFTFNNNGAKYVCVFSNAEFTDFKYVEIYEENFFYAEIYKIIAFATIVICFFVLCIICLYAILHRRVIKPINKLVGIMKEFDNEDCKQRINIEGSTEIENLCDGFNVLIENINKIIEDTKRSEEEKRSAELRALKYQIKPHFLYNTLNSIRILAIYNKQTEISDSIQMLVRLLKKSLSSTDGNVVLSQEMSFVKDYIDLLQIRYNKMIDVSFSVENDAQECVVPNMIIQPIVENAVLHGLASKLAERKNTASLCISAKIDGDSLFIEVQDNGEGMTEEQIKNAVDDTNEKAFTEVGNIGIKNINDRIKLLYGKDYGVFINSKKNVFTNVIIKLPADQEDANNEN